MILRVMSLTRSLSAMRPECANCGPLDFCRNSAARGTDVAESSKSGRAEKCRFCDRQRLQPPTTAARAALRAVWIVSDPQRQDAKRSHASCLCGSLTIHDAGRMPARELRVNRRRTATAASVSSVPLWLIPRLRTVATADDHTAVRLLPMLARWPLLRQIATGGDGTGVEAMTERTHALRP